MSDLEHPAEGSRPASVGPEDLQNAWKWMELHITHRSNVLNYLLVAFGAFAIAYAEMLSQHWQAAAAVAALGLMTALCFLRLDFVTMEKIAEAKAILRKQEGVSAALFFDTKRIFGDRSTTRLFELFLAIAWLLALVYAVRSV